MLKSAPRNEAHEKNVLNSDSRFFTMLSLFPRSLYSRSFQRRMFLCLDMPFVSSCLENTAGLGHVLSHEQGQLIRICCIFAIKILIRTGAVKQEKEGWQMDLGFRHASTPLGSSPQLRP